MPDDAVPQLDDVTADTTGAKLATRGRRARVAVPAPPDTTGKQIIAAVVARLRKQARGLRLLGYALLLAIGGLLMVLCGVYYFSAGFVQEQIKQQQVEDAKRKLAAIHLLIDGQQSQVAALRTQFAQQRERLVSQLQETWIAQPVGTMNALFTVQFLDDGKRGWVVGESGIIMTTENGGANWTAQNSGTQFNLSVVQFMGDGKRGWAAGRQGTILTTVDGGANWATQRSGTTNRLVHMQFLADGRRGWAVGFEGTILTTADSGVNWTAQRSGTTNHLMGIQFLGDGKRGWATGADGTILTTVDSGANWTAQRSGTTNDLASVQFLPDGKRGWAVGIGGTILTTVDGGTNWTAQRSGTMRYLGGVQFLSDGKRGWVVGFEGTILTTADGGTSWAAQLSGTTNDLASVQFLADGKIGWAAGRGGTILTIVSRDLGTIAGGGTVAAIKSAISALSLPAARFSESLQELTLTEDRIATANQTIDKLQVQAAQIPVPVATPATDRANMHWFETETAQLQSLRIGVSIVVLFFVSILLGLYRYSFRMAAHSDARADALELAHIDLGPRFSQLVRALAADGVDFTKGPRNPADQLLEAARNLGRR